jgi:RNA polymerase sigma-70 factor (ECF subfamily)
VTSTIGDRAEDTARADAGLALVISDGTALSWRDVFDEYAPAIASYARSRGVRDVEDLVQDVFVAAVRQQEDFVGDRSGLRSLLFTIAYRRIADHHRRSYRRPETLVPEHTPRPDPGPTVEQVVDLDDSASRAMQAFAVLSDRERRVIEMRLIEDASPASVARALGLTSGNVRVIQSRALVKIRAHLRSMGEGGFAQPIVTVAAMADFVRYLGGKPPTDRLLGPWVEALRSRLFDATIEVTAPASGIGITPGEVTTTTPATDSAHSLLSAVTSSGVARIGAWASVVALSAAPLVPALVPDAESSSSVNEANPVIQAQEEAPPLAQQPSGNSSAGETAAPTGGITIETPTPADSVPVESPQPPSPAPDDDLGQDPGLPVVEKSEPPAVTAPGVVEDVVEPRVTETVEVLVEDVVGPVVDQAVGVVETTVEVVDEVVDTVLEPLEDEVVEPLVDEVVEPLIDEVADSVGGVVPGLGGLLGGQ